MFKSLTEARIEYSGYIDYRGAQCQIQSGWCTNGTDTAIAVRANQATAGATAGGSSSSMQQQPDPISVICVDVF